MDIPPPPSDFTWVILAATAGCAAEDGKWDGNEYLFMTPRSCRGGCECDTKDADADKDPVAARDDDDDDGYIDGSNDNDGTAWVCSCWVRILMVFRGAVRVATVRFRLKAPHGTPMDGQVKLGSYIHITLVYLFGF